VFTLKATSADTRARRGVLTTPHGEVQTPFFMNVATQGAIKGGLDAFDLKSANCQVMLSNTYHLHVRPGDELIRRLGGLHKMTRWDGPILTDSGGFQIFSLSGLRKLTEEGVTFASHVDGKRIHLTPEDVVRIQSNLGSDIAMQLDECCEIPSPYEYIKASAERTLRWAERSRAAWRRIQEEGSAVTQGQLLFGINQGAAFHDIRIEHMKALAELDLPGYAIGGLAVGETHTEMYDTIEAVEPYMPQDRPRYLMGVGTPLNIVEAVHRGVDMFDCVMPSRDGRHGRMFTHGGKLNLNNEQYREDERPIEQGCGCYTCRNFSRAYLRHLLKAKEPLVLRLVVMHNLHFYNGLMAEIRGALDAGAFPAWRRDFTAGYTGGEA
jgi:queuine tRNA-ribosyltransferase